MPPQFVKPYVKSKKNDAADAEAICEAVQRPTMRFVPIKSAEQQGALLLHRTRDLPLRQRSDQLNSITLCGVRHCGQARRARRGTPMSRGSGDYDPVTLRFLEGPYGSPRMTS
jgi:hypothetical protein